MSDKKLICPICGKKFDGCRTCHQKDIISWKTLTDTENHFNIYVILHKYNVLKSITKEQCKKLLLECDIVGYEEFPKHIMENIKDIIDAKEENKHVNQTTQKSVQQSQYKKNTKK